MDQRQVYEAAFRLRCIEMGLDEAQTRERMKRAALRKRSDLDASKVLEWLWSAGKYGGRLGAGSMMASVPITAGIGLGAGYLGGTALAKLTDPGYTPDELSRQEVISTYDNLADDLAARRNDEAEAGL